MKWKNTIPKAPWTGGIYERIVGITKMALRRAIGRKLLREIELITLIAEIEGVLNTRPLTYVNQEDYVIIRPIDFISPNASLITPTIDNNNEDEYVPHKLSTKERLIKYWSNTLKALDIFWETWRHEYLISLRERTQREHTSPRSVETRAPRAGEVVLVNELALPRGMWKLARITEIQRGKDGKIRNVLIEMPNGKTLNRPVNALYPMEADQENLTVQQTAPEKSLNEIDEKEEPIARRTRSAARSRVSTQTT